MVPGKKAVRQQLFKGNEYWFWLGTEVERAKISVHIYDSDGKLAEEPDGWEKGHFAAARYSENYGQLLHHCERRGLAGGTHALGASVWFPLDLDSWRRHRPMERWLEANATIMSETRTLQFESPRALQSLYANDLKLLKTLEESLGVKVTTREGWVKLEGEPSGIDKAQHVFEQLDKARQRGVEIQKHEFNYALDSVTEARDQNLSDLASTKITTSLRKPPIVARSANQREYVEAIQKYDVVFGIGPAGTGKTYLAVAMAVAALKKEQVDRIILTRPAVEAGEALGFLPGDLEQKITPYLRPLYDALRDMLESEEMERAIARQTIEVAPLAYMRGRTLNNAFVILDEAQNTTTEQMFMLLTRIGLNSKCVVTGDVTQIDLPANKRSGVVEALQALKTVSGIATVYFTERDVVRHELVRAIINAYQQHRSPAPAQRK